MFSNAEILSIATKQLALECHCAPSAFSRSENSLTVPHAHPDRRKFGTELPFFRMTTMGMGAVISASEQLHPWLAEWIRHKPGPWLFEHPNLQQLEEQLAAYGMRLTQSYHMFLPLGEAREIAGNWPLKWFEQTDIPSLYSPQFPNALCERFLPERPDMLAVAATDHGKIIGLAGCTADTPLLWQIGIDILPEYRSRGLGTYLVHSLKGEILRRGKIPYYGTSLSALHSWRIALKCGFLPAWIDIESQKA